jgi:hypothetical protein
MKEKFWSQQVPLQKNKPERLINKGLRLVTVPVKTTNATALKLCNNNCHSRRKRISQYTRYKAKYIFQRAGNCATTKTGNTTYSEVQILFSIE